MIMKQNAIIEWRQMNEHLVAFENSQVLDLPIDAQSKALEVNSSSVVIVGLGSGFLLDLIIQNHPRVEVTVIECRESLMSRYTKKYRNVNFIRTNSLTDLIGHSQLRDLQAPTVQKILNDKALGHQKNLFQEIFWYLNLRTSQAVQSYLNINRAIDDRWLINAEQLLEFTEPHQLPYKLSEVLTIKELVK